MVEAYLQQAVGGAAEPIYVVGGGWGVACRKKAYQTVQLVCQGAQDASRRAGHPLTRLPWEHALKNGLPTAFFKSIECNLDPSLSA